MSTLNVGDKFGRWEVIGPCQTGIKHPKVSVRCGCGTERMVNRCNLVTGKTLSCGCLFKERATLHGLSNSPEYKVWVAMKGRCSSPGNPNYDNYGGRGITYCERWEKFENFIADMGMRPNDKMTLERIDNDKGYGPENCEWASRAAQLRNTRRTNLITFKGRTQSLTDWGIELGPILGTSIYTIFTRIHARGWSIEKAFTTPVRYGGRGVTRLKKLQGEISGKK